MRVDSAWRLHNAIKLLWNFVICSSLSFGTFSLAPIVFATSCAYESLMDPLMFIAARRTRLLVMSTVHHTFVLAWAIAMVCAQAKSSDPRFSKCDTTLALPIFLVAIARTAIYAGVLYTPARAIAPWLSLLQFGGLLILPIFSATENVCGSLHASYILPSQVYFVACYLAYNAYIKLPIVIQQLPGVILAFPPKPGGDGEPHLVPMYVPKWAKIQAH